MSETRKTPPDQPAEDTTDPYEDIENVPRSYPNQHDQSGVPDVQYDQPADSLGEHQVSAESLAQEQEEAVAASGDQATAKTRASEEESSAPAKKAAAKK